ncbi:hypothetical protein FHS21_001351 [Phyllobacterium trifolii]|uniref:DUF4376 domain-containing protein n=1 Tax=Phyllobacterium trifolii TaxID=300193 RepID=A0A839U7H1_9HYPH|nr:hypothetical protein [Phyllobacterium trifolii]MBB3144950.1 hypothetical protein [Phyllobacterium trifolii]
MTYNIEDFSPVEGEANQWLHEIDGLFVGREGQTLESMVEEANAPLVKPAISGERVNAERHRRIEAGKSIDDVRVTGRDEDARNLQALLSVAQLRIAGGDTTTTTVFRDGNNVDHELRPAQIVNLFLQSSAFVSDVYAAAWALKALDPIPVDFADDSHWPATGL